MEFRPMPAKAEAGAHEYGAVRDPRAMQAAGSLKDKKAAIASDVKSRYMTMGSWRGSLSKGGQFHVRSSGGGKR